MSITPIIQFGTSRFLQAHADLFISDALKAGDAPGPICVVQSSGDPARAHRLQALAAPEGYPVRVQGMVDGVEVSYETRASAVKCTLSTATDLTELQRRFVDEAEIVISNTGDAGWKPQPQDDNAQFAQPMSFPAKLTHLLRARFEGGGRPIQIMPTELVARNGEVLRDRVLQLAHALDPKFADWVASDVRFVNSLVDRIVSEPLEPAGAVAEPYALWAIEDCTGLILPARHHAVQVVQDLDPVEKQKLHILNLGHSYLVEGWLKRGRVRAEFVRDLMRDPTVRTDLEDLYQTEVLPGFQAAGLGDQASAYIRVTLDRFDNPFLEHKLEDIAGNHTEKCTRRIAAFIDWAQAQGATHDMPRLSQVARRT
ncbi:tagaturonate reductase [Aliiroseovarius halocynthiae]|uniref:Mannitol dehydrogenase family protein n=1 Tax=Aliiroseovarius halocynthiae TaxID=985055 RepID=A0A545SL54_9RHOB|nr:mannitol dehydrogenase family protein [Aliiroseovarius halocynthiae]TQV65714.1 mannitol dehydrogenase family protein [Aliiroseovarius halocynthiae]SMR83957.1 tagaturonate reductase [Aliiroseovarius halocynthiae]